MSSLRSRLFVLWALSLTASLAVAALLTQLYRDSSSAQAGRAELSLSQACDAIADRYAYYVAGWDGPARMQDDPALRDDLAALLSVGLAGRPSVQAGIWQSAAGAITGSIPPDAAAGLTAAGTEAAQTEAPATRRLDAGSGTLLLRACPLSGPIDDLVAWTLVRIESTSSYGALRLGLGVLLALMLLMTGWLTWLVTAWSRRIHLIEDRLAQPGVIALPRLAPTGQAELDRIVAALNLAGGRLAEAHIRAESLAARVAASERLAALGRVAAGVAHEIRNPIAAMRLRAENALAAPDSRQRAALEAILEQVSRLDRLSGELLVMTQRREPAPAPVNLRRLLDTCAANHRHTAAGRRIVTAAPDMSACLDETMTSRALDNLLQNALRHTPPGGTVTLQAELQSGRLRLSVADTGPGVAADLRELLFEPFVTGRPDGTGLGLAIAREMAEAQGGTLTLADTQTPGATFILELPWQPC